MTNLLNNIRFFFKKNIIEALNLGKFLSSYNSDMLRIIMFHDTPKNEHVIYERQIKYLISTGWKILDPRKFIKDKINKKNFLGKNIVITFDDGLKSNKELAERLKIKFGIKSIFFVPYLFIKMKKTNEIKKFCLDKLKINKKKYYKLNLNLNDLKNLIKNGHVVGSHTINHFNLKKINSLKVLNNEIVGSKKLLTKSLKKKINTFAFTYGTLKDISQDSINISLKNYDLIFSGIRGNNIKNSKILFRDEINKSYSNLMCQSLLNGNIDIFYNSSRKKLLKMSK